MIDTKERIIYELREREFLTSADIVKCTGFSRSLIQKYLKSLLDEGIIIKNGNVPNVRYSLIENFSLNIYETFIYKDLEKVYIGNEGFIKWYAKDESNISLKEAIAHYEEDFKKYTSKKENGILDISYGKEIIKEYSDVLVDKILCIDSYNIPLRSKNKRSKLAVLLEIVKNHNNSEKVIKQYLKILLSLTTKIIVKYIKNNSIDCIAFVPPTAKRKIQIMKKLEDEIKVFLPKKSYCKIKKYYDSELRQEQKTINSRMGRIENAKQTFSVKCIEKYNTVLLIDDLIGSGGTVNEIARKMIKQGVAKKVIVLALVGVSSKKFPVVKIS